MLLKEILLDANLLVPNSINDAIKVRWVNQIQSQLYRDFAYPNTSHSFTAEMGLSLYPLPSDCSRERITSVIVGEDIYDYRTVDQDITEHCWTLIDGFLFIHPVPIQNTQAFLNYRPGPQKLRIDMQEVEPEYPKDFHEVLVYGVASRIARSLQDTNRSMELKMIADELHEKAQRELRPARNKTVQINRTWR
jgi:hypothetical protein